MNSTHTPGTYGSYLCCRSRSTTSWCSPATLVCWQGVGISRGRTFPRTTAPQSHWRSRMATKLLITAKPGMARIEVLDGWMQPKGSGYGKLDLPVSPGLYEVRADSGLGQTTSRYCSVGEGQEVPVVLQVPFFSAAPLPDTL